MLKKILLFMFSFAVFLSVQAQDECIQCTSSLIHPECINPEAAGLTPSTCLGPANNRSCFSRIDQEGNVVRGCAAQLSNQNECDSETCQICVGMNMPNGRNGCNNELFPQHRLWCITCAGGENSACAGTTNLTLTVCPLFDSDDQCYTARPNGNYERGCLSSPNKCGDGVPCRKCSGQGCNFEEYNSAFKATSDFKMIALVVAGFVLTALKY